jgi:glycosyltransferase involved in cell wall biosynthesis
MSPKVSVIIPTYNRAATLERAIRSVWAQTETSFELIVVDDGSTDETPERLQALQSAGGRLRVERTENRGVSAARNLGVRVARGQWLAFLDSDDEWLPGKLATQLALLKEQPSLSLVHGEEIWIRRGVRVNPMRKHQKKGGDVFADAVRLCCISPSTVLLRKSLFEELGGFREDFPVCEDYDLWLKITAREKVGFTSEFLIKKYGGHKDQLSRAYPAMDYWRVIALQNVLATPGLSDRKRQLVRQEISRKSSLLLRGYRKHQNLGQYDQIFWIYHSQDR